MFVKKKNLKRMKFELVTIGLLFGHDGRSKCAAGGWGTQARTCARMGRGRPGLIRGCLSHTSGRCSDLLSGCRVVCRGDWQKQLRLPATHRRCRHGVFNRSPGCVRSWARWKHCSAGDILAHPMRTPSTPGDHPPSLPCLSLLIAVLR